MASGLLDYSGIAVNHPGQNKFCSGKIFLPYLLYHNNGNQYHHLALSRLHEQWSDWSDCLPHPHPATPLPHDWVHPPHHWHTGNHAWYYNSWLGVASFPGRRRNGLATSVSSNCYFRCLQVGSTNQISERSHMATVEPNCVMHWTVAVTPILLQ